MDGGIADVGRDSQDERLARAGEDGRRVQRVAVAVAQRLGLQDLRRLRVVHEDDRGPGGHLRGGGIGTAGREMDLRAGCRSAGERTGSGGGHLRLQEREPTHQEETQAHHREDAHHGGGRARDARQSPGSARALDGDVRTGRGARAVDDRGVPAGIDVSHGRRGGRSPGAGRRTARRRWRRPRGTAPRPPGVRLCRERWKPW